MLPQNSQRNLKQRGMQIKMKIQYYQAVYKTGTGTLGRVGTWGLVGRGRWDAGGRVGLVVRALAFYQCSPGSISALGVKVD